MKLTLTLLLSIYQYRIATLQQKHQNDWTHDKKK